MDFSKLDFSWNHLDLRSNNFIFFDSHLDVFSDCDRRLCIYAIINSRTQLINELCGNLKVYSKSLTGFLLFKKIKITRLRPVELRAAISISLTTHKILRKPS
ncbi:hypothetical protein CUMW_240330 [Citrus unshiu]|uniref:Uncharacterized protein n=1 Tax=Citrus unshiu TaxID=55188 RepID=A0A2H5QL35_CITUN|nr:hypothetical protein CUMW_240330 [Citrus unshiu]